MRRAVSLLSPAPGLVLVDGVALRACPWPQERAAQGDRRSSSIAAASILAKVLRDAFLRFCDPLFSGYGLAGTRDMGRPSITGRWKSWPVPFSPPELSITMAAKAV